MWDEALKKIIKECLKLALIMMIVMNVVSYFKSRNVDKSLLSIKDLPLLDGSNYSISGKGKPILLHFWATWCGVCHLESGNIEKISQTYEVITIASRSQSLKNYMEDNQLSFRVVDDRLGNYAAAFNISAFPTTLIYDGEGKLRFSEVGYTSTVGLYLRMWWADFI